MRVTPPPVTTVKLSAAEIRDRRENTRERFLPLGLLSATPQLEDPYSYGFPALESTVALSPTPRLTCWLLLLLLPAHRFRVKDRPDSCCCCCCCS